MSIEFEGINELLNSLEELGDLDNIKDALGNACALVERSAKQKAPKDTGELRRSITSKVEGNGADIQGVIYTPLEYAPYIMCGA